MLGSRLKNIAVYYHRMGLNVTCTSDYENKHTTYYKNILKNPNHGWRHLFIERQTLEELTGYEWDRSLGIGCIAGFCSRSGMISMGEDGFLEASYGSDGQPSDDFPGEAIRVVDVDGCSSATFICELLGSMGLPADYSWVTKTANGYHIIVRAAKPNLDMRIYGRTAVSTFKHSPGAPRSFEKIEFLWNTNVMLPPSLHKLGGVYSFCNGLPITPPAILHEDVFAKIIDQFLVGSSVSHGHTYGEESWEELFSLL